MPLVCARSRQGSATAIAAVIMAIALVTTAVSGAMIYYSRGGSSPSVGIGSNSDSGLSGALSSPAVANLTSALGDLSGLSNSTLSGLTAEPGGPVQVAASSLPAAYFTAAGNSSTFTCSVSPSTAYLALTDSEESSASVTSVTIASSPAGSLSTFDPSGACQVGAPGSGPATYIAFPATSQMSPSPPSGAYYAGVVSLSDGSVIPFEGVWQ
jgi:hypothetical protein